MRSLLLLVVLLVVAAGVALLLLRTVARTEATDEIFVPRGVKALAVDTDTGGVTVTGRPGPARVSVTRRYSLWGPTVRDDLAAGTLSLTADCPGLGLITACEVDYGAEVPPATAVRVEVDAGSITVRGMAGSVRAGSNAGAVSATGLRGPSVVATTDAGDVRVEAVGPPAHVEARSRAGDVEVVVPGGLYRIDAGTRSGEVTLAGVMRDPRAARRIVARTDVGDVTIRGR